MSLLVHDVTVLDGRHYNGDPFWDGDQTLYELDIEDTRERDTLVAVVARGDAFISEDQLRRHLEELRTTVSDLRSKAHSPADGRRPQVALAIEPDSS